MNKDHEIYRAPADDIPEEDKARLDGYLAGRAEAAEVERARAEFKKAMEHLSQSKEPTNA